MALLSLARVGVPASLPGLGSLVLGFVVLVAGLAVLTRRHGPAALAGEPRNLFRALAYVAVYIAMSASFARTLAPALLGSERSPWLLALGDVVFLTGTLFVWVMALAERRPWSAYGFRGGPSGRMVMAFGFGVLVAAFYSLRHYVAVAAGLTKPSPDLVVFALALAALGCAFPEEALFRGYLQSTLDRRNPWLRLGLPALAFTASRAVRHLPGSELPLDRWLFYVLGVAFPLGLSWSAMRDLTRGSLWPSLTSNFLLEFGRALAGASPAAGSAAGG